MYDLLTLIMGYMGNMVGHLWSLYLRPTPQVTTPVNGDETPHGPM